MEERLLKCNDSAETLPLPLYPVSNKENTYRSVVSNISMRDNDSSASDANVKSVCSNNNNKNKTINNNSSYSELSSSSNNNHEWTKIPGDIICCSEANSNNTSEFSTVNSKFTERANSVNLPNNSLTHNSEFTENASTATSNTINTNKTTTMVSSEISYSLITPTVSSVPTPTMRDWVKRASITRSPTKQPRIGAQYPILTHPPALVNTCARQTHNDKNNSSVELWQNTPHHVNDLWLEYSNSSNNNNNNINNNSDICACNNLISMHGNSTCTNANTNGNDSHLHREIFVPIPTRDNEHDNVSLKEDVDEEVDYESVRDSLASSFAASLTPYVAPSSARRKLSVSKCQINTMKNENAEVNVPLHHKNIEKEDSRCHNENHVINKMNDNNDCNQDQRSVSTLSLCSSCELNKDSLSGKVFFKDEEESDNEEKIEKYKAHVDGRSELYVSEATSFSRSSDHEHYLLHESLRCSEASASLSAVETIPCNVEESSTELVHVQEIEEQQWKQKQYEESLHEEHELQETQMEKHNDNCCKNKRNIREEELQRKQQEYHHYHHHHHYQHRSQSDLPFALSGHSSPFTSSASFSSSSYSSSFSPPSSRLLHHSSHSVSQFIRSNSISRYHSMSSITSLPSSTSVSAAHYICQPATPLVNWEQSQWVEEAWHPPESVEEEQYQHKLHKEPLELTKNLKETSAQDNISAITGTVPFSTLPPKIPTLTSPRPCNFVNRFKDCNVVKRGKVDLSPRPVCVAEEPFTQLHNSCEPSTRHGCFEQREREEHEKRKESNNRCDDSRKGNNELYGMTTSINKQTEKDLSGIRSDHHHHDHDHYRHHRRRNISPSLARPSGELINNEIDTNNLQYKGDNKRNECTSKENLKLCEEECERLEECEEHGQEEQRIDDEPLGRASILSTCSPLEDEPQVDEVHYLLEQMKNEEADSEAITEQEINYQAKRVETLSQCARDTLQLENNLYDNATFTAHYDECINTKKMNHHTEQYQENVSKSATKPNVNGNYLSTASAWDRATSSPPMRDRSMAPAELLAEQVLRQHMKQNKSTCYYNAK